MKKYTYCEWKIQFLEFNVGRINHMDRQKACDKAPENFLVSAYFLNKINYS